MLKKYTYYFFIFVFSFFFFIPPIFSVEPPQYVPGRLIIKYKQTKKQTAQQMQITHIKAERSLITTKDNNKDSSFYNQFAVLEVTEGKEDEIIRQLKTNPDIEYVERDGIYKATIRPNDPGYQEQWSYYNSPEYYVVNLEPVWEQQIKDNTGLIAIIDTGIDTSHEDLKDKIWINPGEIQGNGVDDDGNGYIDDIYGWNSNANTNQIVDDYGHGTIVSGVIGASSNNGKGMTGAAWEGKMVIVKANVDNSGIFNYSSVDRALAYILTSPKIKVINLSLGGSGYSQSQRDFINRALSAGKLIVAAAGNDGKNLQTNPFYPASYKGVLAIASHRTSGLAASNYGYRIDIAAPGDQIYTTFMGGGYGKVSGTSLASPLVAGTAYLFMQHYPDLTNNEITQVFRSWSLQNVPYCFESEMGCNKNTWNRDWGYGRLSGVESFTHACLDGKQIRSTVIITEPDDRQTIQSSGIVTIKGTVQSNVFQKYTLEWGRGGNPTTWSNNGITLANGGLQQVQNGILGTLDMTQFLSSDFYLIRAVASGSAACKNNVVGEDRTGIFVQRQFTISGKITNLSKLPVPNVYVQFYQNNTGVGWVQTNINGEYTKSGLAAGSYSWVPSLGTGLKETYIPASRSGTLAEGQPNLINQDFVQQLSSPTSIPTPTTVPTKVPTIPPTVIPIIPTIKPTVVPTLTPIPTPIQYPPEIVTNKLPPAQIHRLYIWPVVAVDKNKDAISVSIKGLPKGVSKTRCISLPGITTCILSGIPKQKGTFVISITAIDSTKKTTTKNLDLVVK